MTNTRHVESAPTETRALATGNQVTRHQHDDHQVVYASAGVIEVTVDAGTWFSPAARAVWIPAGTAHTWVVRGSSVVHLVGVPPGIAPHLSQEPSLIVMSPLLRELVVAHSNESSSTAAAQRLLRVLVDRVEIATEPATILPASRDHRLRDVRIVLEERMSETLSLADLARAVGSSERTISRLLRAEIGMSFNVWRNQIRLRRASLLLAEGHSVTYIAAACGWSSPSAFIASFRDAFGHTPGSLAKTYRT